MAGANTFCVRCQSNVKTEADGSCSNCGAFVTLNAVTCPHCDGKFAVQQQVAMIPVEGSGNVHDLHAKISELTAQATVTATRAEAQGDRILALSEAIDDPEAITRQAEKFAELQDVARQANEENATLAAEIKTLNRQLKNKPAEPEPTPAPAEEPDGAN